MCIRDRAKAAAERIQQTLPTGTEIYVAFDSTTFIDSAVERVYATLVEACLLYTSRCV